MNESAIINAMQALKKMIEDTKKQVAFAIEREDWLQAAEMNAYLHGLEMAYVMFNAVM